MKITMTIIKTMCLMSSQIKAVFHRVEKVGFQNEKTHAFHNYTINDNLWIQKIICKTHQFFIQTILISSFRVAKRGWLSN